jgi:hypothetical protein
MATRYQVFISSTFTDLQEERVLVQNMLMQLDCIPAGMELFPAIDEEQLDFIKKIIDDSDYYLLIIGGRYGSVGKDGISYTEKEYDYAVSKGMKVIALIHKDPKQLTLEKSEKDAKARKSLEKFKNKVLKGRIVLFWNNASELPGKLAQSLPVTIKTYPAVGWVRASAIPSADVYKELNDLRKENQVLKDAAKNASTLMISNIAGLSSRVKITVNLKVFRYTNKLADIKRQVNITWGDLFDIAAPFIFINSSEAVISEVIAKNFADRIVESEFFDETQFYKAEPSSYYLEQNDFEKIRIQFRALDLITLTTIKPNESRQTVLWGLTPEGERQLLISKAIRQEDV